MQFWTSEIEKQVGARVQTVLESPELLSLHAKFGAEVFRRSSVFHGLGRILADNKVRGRRCFEVGTWNCLTAVVLSKHFDEVVTVDIAHNDIKHEVLRHLGITNVRCIDITDNDQKAKVARKTDFDFAYLDGDHAHDTERDFYLVQHCGRVLFHEVWPWQRPVWNLVHTLPAHQVKHNGQGLALWDSKR